MPKLAGPFVESMARYQALGRDIEMLRDYLAAHQSPHDVGVRVLACILATTELQQSLVRLQILAVGNK